jgi:hypothetical protein
MATDLQIREAIALNPRKSTAKNAAGDFITSFVVTSEGRYSPPTDVKNLVYMGESQKCRITKQTERS